MLTPEDISILNTYRAIGDRWTSTGKRILETVEWCISHRSMKGLEEMDFAFDPTGITPGFGGGAGGLPVGKHPVTITKSEGKPTRDNTGGFLELTCTAFDGPAKGMSQALRLNVHNTSEVAVRIAKEQLAAICAVTGVGPFQNTSALHDKPFVVEVTPQKNDPKYTEITAVFDMNGNEPANAAPGGQQQNGGFQGANGTGTIPPQNQGGGFGGGQQQDQQQGQQQGGGFGQQQQGQDQQQGGNGGFGGGQGGNGGFGQQQQQGGGAGWQQGGGAANGGGGPGWGKR